MEQERGEMKIEYSTGNNPLSSMILSWSAYGEDKKAEIPMSEWVDLMRMIDAIKVGSR